MLSCFSDCVFQVSCLSYLTGLQQLSLADNPCVEMTANREYPLAVNWYTWGCKKTNMGTWGQRHMKESSKMGVVSGLLILLVPWSVIQDHFWFVNFKRQTTWFGQNYFDVCSDTVSLWLMRFVILSFSSLDELGNCVSHWLMIQEWLNRQIDSWITAGVQKVSMLSDNHCRCAEGVHVVWQSLQMCRRCPCCLTITAGVQKVSMLSDDHCMCAKGVHVVWQSLQVCRRCPCCLTITADVKKVSMLFGDHCRCAEGHHVVWWSLHVCKRCPCCLTITAGVQKVSMLSDNHCRCAEGDHVVWQSLQMWKRCPCCLVITAGGQKVSMLSDNHCRCAKGIACCRTNTAGVQKVSMLSDNHCRCVNGGHVVWRQFPNHLTGFDYRPYVLCCCPSLQVLDGYILSEGERWVASACSPSSPPDDLVMVHVYIMCMYFTLNHDNRGYFWIMIRGVFLAPHIRWVQVAYKEHNCSINHTIQTF